MTGGYVGLDTTGLRSLADVLDRQADRAADAAADAQRALLLSELPGDVLLSTLRRLSERDRASATELRRRVQLAEEFRVELTVTTLELVSANEHGRALRDELAGIDAAIDGWAGSDNDPRLDELIAWRRSLLTELSGGDRTLAARVSRLLDSGASLDEALMTVAAWRIDEQLDRLRAEGKTEVEAVRVLDTELWIGARTIDLVADGLEALAARQQASFENDVAVAIASGYSPDVAAGLVAAMYLEGGQPIPDGIEPLDSQKLVDRVFAELDIARDRGRGEAGEADGFVSFDDLEAVVDPANAHLFSPDVILAASAALDRAAHDEDFAEQFLGDGFVDWLVKHRDEIVRGAALVGGVAIAVASGGSLSPLGLAVVGLAVGAGAAATTVGINALSQNFDLWDNVAENFGSGAVIGMSAAGLVSAGRLVLSARAAGRSATSHIIGVVGETAALTSEGAVDLVTPDRFEDWIHATSGSLSSAIGLYQVGEQIRSTAAVAIASRADEVSIVYRVQGGIPPAASRDRISIGELGQMLVDDPDDVLYVTFDDVGRARAFSDINRPGSRIIAFDVDPEFVDELRAVAVAQHEARNNPALPHIADITKTESSFGLPTEWIERLTEHAKIGTGRFVE